jgi:hypothetical protein
VRPRTLLLAILVLIALPVAAADPPLTLARYGVAPVGGTPVVASNGSDFVLVWLSGQQIKVLRPSVRHGGGLPLATPVADDATTTPSLAWSGSRFAMVYGIDHGEKLIMLDGDGNAVTAPRLISSGFANAGGAQVAWDGKHFLVVYRNTNFPTSLYGQLLTNDGENEGDPFPIVREPSPSAFQPAIRIASNGNGFMIAFASADRARVFAVGADGRLLKQTLIAVAYTDIAIATDGHDYLVVWPGSNALNGAIISPEGTLRDTPRVIASTRSNAENPAVSWNGSSYIVAFTDSLAIPFPGHADGDVYVSRVAGDATPLGAAMPVATGDRMQNAPSVASTASGDMIAFADTRFTLDDPDRYPHIGGAVRALSLESGDTLTPLAGLGADGIASLGAADQDLVAAADGTFGTLVVWRETLGTTRSMRYGRLSRDNQWLDGEGNEIDASPDFMPGVASSGDMFLIAWPEKSRIRMTRVDRNGGLIDPKPVDLAEQQNFGGAKIAVAWVGNAFVVIYAHDYELVAKRIDRDGIVLDSRVIRPRSDGDRVMLPTALFNGQTLLVAYNRLSPCPFTVGPCAVGVRTETIALDANLEPRASRPVVLEPRDDLASMPSIAWNGSVFAVVWPSYYEIKTAALDYNGRLIGRSTAFGMSNGRSFYGSVASVAWDKNAFRVIYNELGSVSETALDDSAIPSGPERSHSGVAESGPAATAGSLGFYPARIDEAPWYGAKRIVTTTTAPFAGAPPPSAVQLTRRPDGRLLITWSYAGNAGGFHIEARERSGAFHEIAATDGHARSTTIDLPLGATIRVRAWVVNGFSPYSDEAVFNPPRRRVSV